LLDSVAAILKYGVLFLFQINFYSNPFVKLSDIAFVEPSVSAKLAHLRNYDSHDLLSSQQLLLAIKVLGGEHLARCGRLLSVIVCCQVRKSVLRVGSANQVCYGCDALRADETAILLSLGEVVQRKLRLVVGVVQFSNVVTCHEVVLRLPPDRTVPTRLAKDLLHLRLINLKQGVVVDVLGLEFADEQLLKRLFLLQEEFMRYRFVSFGRSARGVIIEIGVVSKLFL
jgi:hypothetical protein